MLAECVCVAKLVLLFMIVVDTVVVADCVFVVTAVAVPQELSVVDLELLVDAVYVAEEVDVLVDEDERVSAVDSVPLEDLEAEPVEDIVGGGRRVTETVPVSVTEGRRETLPQADAVAVRDCFAVADSVGVVVYVAAGIRVTLPVREMGGVNVSPLQRVGEGELDGVFEWGGVRVGVTLVFRERESLGENVPVLEDVIVRVAVPEAVGLLEISPLRDPVEDTVDVFD